ncbi:MAG: hypothetical protein ACT4OT_05590 [Acidobacteriota bacterium]
MPTNRNHLRCDVCGTRTITRVSLIYGPYREFAFPCPGCGVEIRVGVEVIVPTRDDIERWVNDTKLPEERLEEFTLAQKRFEDLKALYVDSFETLCRISVIAATVEGIISKGKAVVLKSKGEFTIAEFDMLRNGNKPDVLNRLGSPVADLFVPYIDHRLRNGS